MPERFVARLLAAEVPILPLAGLLWILPAQYAGGLTISLAYAAFSYLAVFGFVLARCEMQ